MRSQEIDKQIEEDSRKFKKECKILLLGELYFFFKPRLFFVEFVWRSLSNPPVCFVVYLASPCSAEARSDLGARLLMRARGRERERSAKETGHTKGKCDAGLVLLRFGPFCS